MFKIQYTDGGQWRVSHYVKGDSLPTATEKLHDRAPDAWHDAFGRAAKMCLFLNEPQQVETWDGRVYEVTVRQVKP